MRPIAHLSNPQIIVSPTDSTFAGSWEIDEQSNIYNKQALNLKGLKWSIHQLLEGSRYRDSFKEGLFTHSSLEVSDYHRFHSPVGGTVIEVYTIQGQAWFDTQIETKSDGKRYLKQTDYSHELGVQFLQAHGVLILETVIGLVACVPVDMADISSVIFTAQKGVSLRKGEELGYFQFGGSDFILVFQKTSTVQLFGKRGQHYLQGSMIGESLMALGDH